MRSGTCFAVVAIATGLAASNLAAQTVLEEVLEEVLVTAQKREQPLQEVPLAVTAVSGDALQAFAVTELEILGAQQPNLHVSESAIGDKLFIRGIGSGINAGFEQSVGTFVDGVYHGRSLQSRAQFLDVERVEVLRGPQSTYFGNNAVAGALNITTRRPSYRFSGFVNSQLQTALRGYHLQAAAGGPLSEALAIRVAGLASGHDGWIDNRLTGQSEGDEKNRAGRISAMYTAEDTFNAVFKLEAASFGRRGRNLQVTACPPASGAAGACALLQSLPVVSGFVATPLPYSSDGTAYNGPVPAGFIAAVHGAGAREAGVPIPAPASYLAARDRGTGYTRNASLTLNRALPGYRLTAITGYSSYRADFGQTSDFLPVPLAAIAQGEDFSQFSQELRLDATAFGTVDYMVGLYHHDARLRVQEDIGFYLPPPWFQPAATWFSDPCRERIDAASASCRLPATLALASVDHRQHESSQALFGAFAWHLTPALKLGLSARYASTRKQLARRQVFYDRAPGVTVNCSPAAASSVDCKPGTPLLLTAASPPHGTAFGWRPGSLDLGRRDTGFSPAIDLQWSRAGLMLYGSYSRGFKAGGFDQRNLFLGAASGQFGPESVRAMELGLKASMADDRVSLNLALFQASYDSLQVSTFDGVVNFMVNNAASARSRGIEADLWWHISPRLVASAAVALLDAHWRDYGNAQCRAVDLALALSDTCRINAASGLLVQDLSGEPLPMSPRRSGSFHLAWTYPLSRGLQVKTDFDAYLQDEQYLAADNDPATRHNGYGKANLRVALASREGWELALVIRNLTGTRTASHVDDLPLGSVNSFFRLADRPRTVMLQAQFHW